MKMLFVVWFLSVNCLTSGTNYHEELDISAYGALGVGREMIVFDLDRTIWPFEIDKDVNNQFERLGAVENGTNKDVEAFSEAIQALDYLQREGYFLAVISQEKQTKASEYLMELCDLERFFNFQILKFQPKVKAFESLHSLSNVEYEDMLYFDDDLEGTKPLLDLNVTVFKVDGNVGLTMKDVNKSLEIFAARPTRLKLITTTTLATTSHKYKKIVVLDMDKNHNQTE